MKVSVNVYHCRKLFTVQTSKPEINNSYVQGFNYIIAVMTETRSREEAFVAECFTLLSRFSNDKLKDLVEKEKGSRPQKQQELTAWITFLTRLVNFGDLEHLYCMAFLGSSHFSRFFSKKEDNLKGQYAALLTDIRCVSNTIVKNLSQTTIHSKRDVSTQPPTTTHLNNLVVKLLNQLEHFIIARTNILIFYEQLPTESSEQPLVSDDLFRIVTSTQKQITCGLMQPLKDTYVMEATCLQHLLTAQHHLQRPLHLESLLSLISAHNLLHTWCSLLNHNKVRKSTFAGGTSKNVSSPPEIFSWLLRLKNHLLSKFTLYFYEVVSNQAGHHSELKNLLAKTSCDYYSKIMTFSKKMDTFSIMFLTKHSFDAGCHGYVLPVTKVTDDSLVGGSEGGAVAAGGKAVDACVEGKNFGKEGEKDMEERKKSTERSGGGSLRQTIFFSYPPKRPGEECLKRLKSILQDKTAHNKATYHFVYGETYVTARVEGDITLAVVLNRDLSKPDKRLSDFVNFLCADLRGCKHFNNIKSGIK